MLFSLIMEQEMGGIFDCSIEEVVLESDALSI